MSDIGLLACLVISSVCGSLLGFGSGLVPGLHVNNVAAAIVACSGGVIAMFSMIGHLLGCDAISLLVSSLLVSSLISHSFSEAVPNTYVGVPASDAVSVLPAHGLAKAGLGWLAVRSSIEGSMVGVLLGVSAMVPVCIIMGPWIGGYSAIRPVMGLFIILLSVLLVLSDRGWSSIAKASSVFCASGLLGVVIFESGYFASDLSPLPFGSDPVSPSSLLLPLFAGLFGIPTLLLSLSQTNRTFANMSIGMKLTPEGHRSEGLLTLLGGILVGWIPGMTSGSSATLCAIIARRPLGEGCGIDASRRFIWLYSAISSAGAVLSLGALFIIARARSGIMDAVTVFLVNIEPLDDGMHSLMVPCSLLLSMVISALLSYTLMQSLRRLLRRSARHLLSDRLSMACIVFICLLTMILTGARGIILLAAACSLGLLPPMLGIRRIHLMGCLLLPISLSFMLG